MKMKRFIIVMFALTLLVLVGCSKPERAGKSQLSELPIDTVITADDLSGETIGIMEGTTSEQILSTYAPEAKLSIFKSNADAIAAVRAKKCDSVLLLEPEALGYAKSNSDLKYYITNFKPDEHSIAINKKNPELRDKISETIKKFKADGTLDTIISNWMVPTKDDYIQTNVPELSNAPVIKVAMTSTREPVSFMIDGKLTGIGVEVIKTVAYEMGYKVEFLDMYFAATLAAVTSGRCDATICVSITEERKKTVDFTEPYMPSNHVLLMRNNITATQSGGNNFMDGVIEFFGGIVQSFNRTFIVENRWQLVLSGLWLTIVISVFAMIFGTLIGALICALNRSKKKLLSGIAKVFIRILQGTPIVVILMLLYYVVFGNVDISAIIVAIIGFSFNFAAYTSEMFRTGIDAVDKGQLEAASASGFSKLQAFIYITLPQAAKHIIPVYKGEFIAMVKMTSVVGYIAIQDLTKVSDIIRSRTFEAFFPLIATAVIYFAITYLFILILNFVEFKIDPKRRKRIIKGVTIND